MFSCRIKSALSISAFIILCLSICFVNCSSNYEQGEKAISSGQTKVALERFRKVKQNDLHFSETQGLIRKIESDLEKEKIENELKEALPNSFRNAVQTRSHENEFIHNLSSPTIVSSEIVRVDTTDIFIGYALVDVTGSHWNTGADVTLRSYDVWTYNTENPNDWYFETEVSAGDASTDNIIEEVDKLKATLIQQYSSKALFIKSELKKSIDMTTATAKEIVEKTFKIFIASLKLPDSITIENGLTSFDSSQGFGPIKWKMSPEKLMALSKEYGYIDANWFISGITEESQTIPDGDTNIYKDEYASIKKMKSDFMFQFSKWNQPIVDLDNCYDHESRSGGNIRRCSIITKYISWISNDWFLHPQKILVSNYQNQGLISFVLKDPLKLTDVQYLSEVFLSKQYNGVFAITFKSTFNRLDTLNKCHDKYNFNGEPNYGYTLKPCSYRYFGNDDDTYFSSDINAFSKIISEYDSFEDYLPFLKRNSTVDRGNGEESFYLLAQLFKKYGIGNTRCFSFGHKGFIFGKILAGKKSVIEYGVQYDSGGGLMAKPYFATTICFKAATCNIPTPFIAFEHADEIIVEENRNDSLTQVKHQKEMSDSIAKFRTNSINTDEANARNQKKVDF